MTDPQRWGWPWPSAGPPPRTEPPPTPPAASGRRPDDLAQLRAEHDEARERASARQRESVEAAVNSRVERIKLDVEKQRTHTAALDNLADAVRELAAAIRTRLEAPHAQS